MTLKQGVENMLMHYVPEVKEVTPPLRSESAPIRVGFDPSRL